MLTDMIEIQCVGAALGKRPMQVEIVSENQEIALGCRGNSRIRHSLHRNQIVDLRIHFNRDILVLIQQTQVVHL
jgi:hypothetical protein